MYKTVTEYFVSKRDEISFIELKPESNININGFKLDPKIPLPLVVNDLINEIKENRAQEEIKLSAIIKGIIYIIGIDPDFKHNEEYKKILYEAIENAENHIRYEGFKSINENSIDEGLVYFKALYALNESNSDTIFDYAVALEKKAENFYSSDKRKSGKVFLKKSTELLEELLSSDKAYSPAYYKLGYHYLNEKQFIKAKYTWEKFIETTKDNDISREIKEKLEDIKDNVKYEEGYNEIFRGNPNEGLLKLSELEEKYETWWNLIFLIGLCYRQLGSFNEAKKRFERVLEIKSDQSETLNELGLCLVNLGDFDEAITRFTEALNTDNNNDYEILCNRGMTYLQLGRVGEAKIDIYKAIEISPEDEITKACKKEIDKY